jgi:hypothetical protein
MDNPSISESEINNFLIRRLGEKEAGEIMDYIHSEVNRQVVARGNETMNEISLWRSEMKNEFATKQDAEDLRTKLVKRVSAVEGTIIIWAFVFWFTLIIAMYIIFKFMH